MRRRDVESARSRVEGILKLLALADWLSEHALTHIAMESTGEYWKPVYNILEDQFTLWVVNAHHVKHVPGRKTDMKDAECSPS